MTVLTKFKNLFMSVISHINLKVTLNNLLTQ